MELQAENLIALLRSSIDASTPPTLCEPDYGNIYLLAQKHALTALLYPAAKRVCPAPPILGELKKLAFGAATRETLQAQELSQILDACEEEGICVLPLKGCIIKHLYPNPELRYMSDIDLLIEPKNAKKLRSILLSLGHKSEKTDCTTTEVYASDLSLRYEIHLDLSSEGFNDASRAFLRKLLSLSVPKQGRKYIRELPLEEHYAYILCHFVKHFIYGGIGIRQLLDLYICQKKWQLDQTALEALLDSLGLTAFHKNTAALGKHWFEGAQADTLVQELGAYIVSSGVFGNEEQRVTDRMLQQGRGAGYLWRRIFPPFRTMKEYFPILKPLPFLLPIYWIWRALRAVLFRREKLSTEIAVFDATDVQTLNQRAAFYRNCGLQIQTKGSQL